jgi:hypothetical protein
MSKKTAKPTKAQLARQLENDLELRLTISSAIDKIELEYGVSIGLQLDADKIAKIINHMIENGLKTVNIKFEVWK